MYFRKRTRGRLGLRDFGLPLFWIKGRIMIECYKLLDGVTSVRVNGEEVALIRKCSIDILRKAFEVVYEMGKKAGKLS